MKKSTLVIIFLLFILSIVVGYSKLVLVPRYNQLQRQRQLSEESAQATISAQVNSPSSPQFIQERVSKMSVEEKLAQLIALRGTKDDLIKIGTESAVPGFWILDAAQISSTSATSNITQPDILTTSTSPVIIADLQHPISGRKNQPSGVPTQLRSTSDFCRLSPAQQILLLDQVGNTLKNHGIEIVVAPQIDMSPQLVDKKDLCDADPLTTQKNVENWISAFSNKEIRSLIPHNFSLTGNEQVVLSNVLTKFPQSGVEAVWESSSKACAFTKECISGVKREAGQISFIELDSSGSVTSGKTASGSATVNKKTLGSLMITALKAGHTVVIVNIDESRDRTSVSPMKTLIESLKQEMNQDLDLQKMVNENVAQVLLFKSGK
jgi:hypothetical protein